MATEYSELFLGQCIEHGLMVELRGRFTMNQSRSFQDLVCRSLQPDPELSLVVSLAECEYLDSTFLGCLVKISKLFPTRVAFASDSQTTTRLFQSCPLQSVLRFVEELETVGELQHVDLPEQTADLEDFARDVLQCHRYLAATPGPMQEAFERVVEQLERELGECEGD